MAWVEVVLLEMKGAHLRVSVQGKMLRHVPTDVDDPPLQQIWVRRKGMKAYPIAINILAVVWGTKRHTAVLRHPIPRLTERSLSIEEARVTSVPSTTIERKMLGAVFEHQLGLRAVFADDVMITKCERPYSLPLENHCPTKIAYRPQTAVLVSCMPCVLVDILQYGKSSKKNCFKFGSVY